MNFMSSIFTCSHFP